MNETNKEKKLSGLVFNTSLWMTTILFSFFLLAILNELIPSSWFEVNAISAGKLLYTEGSYSMLSEGEWFDNFTDACLINSLLTVREGSIIENAVANAYTLYVDVDDPNGFENRTGIFRDEVYSGRVEIVPNSRYWTGSKLLFKILLSIMSLYEIRHLMVICVALLFVLNCYELIKKTNIKVSAAFAVSVVAYMYINNSQCMAYFFDIIMMLCVNLIVLKQCFLYEKVFLVTGMLCGFCCFWSFPLITLTYPLITLSIFCWYRKYDNKRIFAIILKQSVLWTVGIVVTVLFKQILSYIILGDQSGTKEIAFRLGEGTGFKWRIITPIYRVFNEFSYSGILFSLLIIMVITICVSKSNHRLEQRIALMFFCMISIVARICMRYGLEKTNQAKLFIVIILVGLILVFLHIHKKTNSISIKLNLIYLIRSFGFGWIITAVMCLPVLWGLLFINHCGHGYTHFMYGGSYYGLLLLLFDDSSIWGDDRLIISS